MLAPARIWTQPFMTDKTEFSFDLTLGHSMSHGSKAELFAFDDCKAYPLPDRKLLIRNPYNGKSAVVMSEVYSALNLCREFRSLEEHIANIEEAIPTLRGQPEEIRRVLDTMCQQGMLVPPDAVLQDLQMPKAGSSHEAAGPAVVVIITWERPAALTRLLDSIKKNGDPKAIERLYVVDDTRTAANIALNREAVAGFADGSPVDARYFGREEQEALLADIASRIPQHEASLRFLADSRQWEGYWTSGLARNFALLLSMGKKLVMIDDDALFEVWEPPDMDGDVSLAEQPSEANFFEKPGEWRGMHLRQDTDPVSAHLECLGAAFGDALQRLGQPRLDAANLAGSRTDDVRRLKADSPVLITECGTVGDPGTGGNGWLIELEGPSRERMLQSEESVQRAIRNNNVWLGRRRPRVSGRSNMSLITGLDNRAAVPPYFPIMRGEDRLFGVMLGMLFPKVAVLDYAWASPHLPQEERDRSSEETHFGAQRPFPRFFVEWLKLQADRCSAGTYAHRLAALAGHYEELASMDDMALSKLYWDELTHSACETMKQLRAAIDRGAGTPAGWVKYLESGLHKVNVDVVESFQRPVITGTPGGVQGGELFALWREHWRAFGAALRAWPEIRSAAAG
jgi:hypothetical protein